jgi:hypothetical protein
LVCDSNHLNFIFILMPEFDSANEEFRLYTQHYHISFVCTSQIRKTNLIDISSFGKIRRMRLCSRFCFNCCSDLTCLEYKLQFQQIHANLFHSTSKSRQKTKQLTLNCVIIIFEREKRRHYIAIRVSM